MYKLFLITFLLFVSCSKSIEYNYTESVKIIEHFNHLSNDYYQSFAKINLWMFNSDNKIANWLNRYDFDLYEPINVIWIDYTAKNISEAQNNIFLFLNKCGYITRMGSSIGYYTTINDIEINQIPLNLTWSDNENALNENNHGRVFASHNVSNNLDTPVFYSTGCFSRESATYHDYISFNIARDQLKISGNWIEEENMLKSNIYNPCTSITECKKNNIILSTMDHNGIRIFVLYP